MRRVESDGPRENHATERFAAVKFSAGSRSVIINCTKLRLRIQRDAGAVTALLHATHAVVLDDIVLRHPIARSQFHDQMAATAATGAGWKFGIVDDASQQTTLLAISDL